MAGCESGRTRAPAVSVRVLHAAPDRGALDFLRERRSEAQLEFRQASGRLSFEADQYDFNVRAIDANGTTTTPLGSFSAELVPDNQYFIAITEAAGVLTPIVVEKPAFTGTSAEITAVHAAPSLGPLSIYIEPEAVVPAGAAPVGTLAFGEAVASATREPGNYRLSLTEAGNPANVLMRSVPIALAQGTSYVFSIIDIAGDSVAPITVAVVGPEATLLIDEGIQASLTVVNTAADGNPRDLFVDDDFSAPLLAAIPSPSRSQDTSIAFGARKLIVTPAGNTGVIEAEHNGAYARGRQHIALIGGDPGELDLIAGVDDRRRIIGQARIALLNGATQYEQLEYFLVPPGTDITGIGSTLVLGAPGITPRLVFAPGDYELIVREVNGGVVAGPVPVTLAGSGIYSVLTTNGATSGTADFVFFEDFLD